MKLDITTAKILVIKINEELKNQIISGNEITEKFAFKMVDFVDRDNILNKEKIENAARVIFLNNFRLKTYKEYYSIYEEAIENALDDSFLEFLINVLIQT